MNDIRKGVYILPNLFTSASLFCGFYAIVRALETTLRGQRNFKACAIAIVAAALFDGLDGRVARKTKTATRFGVEYDSLVDLVSFGVAPALILYMVGLRGLGRAGWIASFLYLACGALRLARFNVQATGVEKKYFQGLPIPMAALMVAAATLIWDGRPFGDVGWLFKGDERIYLFGMAVLLAGLMVSMIPYRSFKTFNLTGRHPFSTLVLVVVGLGIWATAVTLDWTQPWWLMFVAGAGYILSGPIEKWLLPPPIRVYRRVRQRRRVKKVLERIDRLSETTRPTEVPDSDSPDNVHPLRRS